MNEQKNSQFNRVDKEETPKVSKQDSTHENEIQELKNTEIETKRKEIEGGVETKVIDLIKTKDAFNISKALCIIDENIVAKEDPNKSRWGHYYNDPHFDQLIEKFLTDMEGVNKFAQMEYALRDGYSKVYITYRGKNEEVEIRVAGHDAFRSEAVKKWEEVK